jgi:hypothetical protein
MVAPPFSGTPRRGSCDEREAGDDGFEVIPAIEAVFEFGEIAGHMFFPDGAVCSEQRGLHFAEHGVASLEGWRL